MKKENSYKRRVLTEAMLGKLAKFLYQLECVSSVYINIELKNGAEISAIRNLDTVQAEREEKEDDDFEDKWRPRTWRE